MKAGLAYRHLGQDTAITAVSNLGPRSVNYREQLDTDYWGAYVGATGRWNVGWGVSLTLDGEVGIYQALSDYRGFYTAKSNTNPNANLTQTLSLDRDRTTAIVGLKLAADKDFGPFSIGAFVRGELCSYAPKMAYNDVDLTGGVGQNLVGSNDGTRIDNGTAWGVTTGARLTIPFGN